MFVVEFMRGLYRAFVRVEAADMASALLRFQQQYNVAPVAIREV